jgi:hypothetical protein
MLIRAWPVGAAAFPEDGDASAPRLHHLLAPRPASALFSSAKASTRLAYWLLITCVAGQQICAKGKGRVSGEQGCYRYQKILKSS